MSYSLNKDGAKQANEKLSGYIDKNGDYLLKINMAEWISGQAPKQSRGVRFHLLDVNKSRATIDLWFQKADGSRNDMSANMLDGLMTCVGLQNLTESNLILEGNTLSVCPELQNKVFGALIQTEKHAYMKNGEVKEIDKPMFYAVYQYKTNLTPAEILNGQTSPSELGKLKSILDGLKPRFTKEYKELKNGGSNAGGYDGTPKVINADLDDDLPF